jgi:hypothetical protein
LECGNGTCNFIWAGFFTNLWLRRNGTFHAFVVLGFDSSFISTQVCERNISFFEFNKYSEYTIDWKADIDEIEIEWVEQPLVSPLLRATIAIFRTVRKETLVVLQNGGSGVYFDIGS